MIVKEESSTIVAILDNKVDVMDYTAAFTTEEVFTSREELIRWTHDVGKKNGLVIVIKRSDVNVIGRRPRIIFACERSGAYPKRSTSMSKQNNDLEKKKRPNAIGTKKCGCPFLLKGQMLANNQDWMLKVICGLHNHHSAQYLEGHSFAGRLTNEEVSILVDLSKNNVRPKEILHTLKTRDTFNVTTMKTIYNARYKYKVRELGGRSQMQQLMSKLHDHNYIEWHRSDDDTNCVKDIFWAHPLTFDLLKAFPSVLIMDCTYKVNKYKFSLLEIVGVTSTAMTFNVGFAYLESEREDNYIWALERLKTIMQDDILPTMIVTDRELALMNAIEKIFPSATNLLCRWHISRNVLANCKKLFETNERWEAFNSSWNVLVFSATEQEYIQHLTWTDFIMHFGNMTTNRAETAHSKLKRQLCSSQGNFVTLWTKLYSLVELQHTEIKASFEKSLTTVQHSFTPSVFKELRGLVARNALDMILSESKRANLIGIDISACGCVVRHTHGLPCAHEIGEYKREGRPIPLDSVHSHWRKLDLVCTSYEKSAELSCTPKMEMIIKSFEDSDGFGKMQIKRKLKELTDPSSTFLIEPTIKDKTRGRPSQKLDKSTRRDPSRFEYVVSAQDNHSPNIMSSSTTTKKPKGQRKMSVSQTKAPKHASYIDSFPFGLRPYICGVSDVVADGNCGFRAVANLIGIGEDSWAQVRKDLVIELQSHFNDYKRVFEYAGRAEEVLHSLLYFENNPGREYWMTMPEIGHIIASKYNVVLLHISDVLNLTFLPLRSIPLSRSSHKIIAIGFVNRNHFIEVFMLPASPIPPIANSWIKYHEPCAEGWATPYKTNIIAFKDLVFEVTTQETIDLASQ
ncbi:protein FAR1-RELATED SEQUENCE [Citrus sinensis]|uniref:Protein FAR1-RELATED SEQUENCE n=1 Tax=Citrus sinensis TaxID=2711 RepID=A0ACB8K796_CITSI|nr:protein FAR1-RELATED SEQUENCE [Citrus sinensis]